MSYSFMFKMIIIGDSGVGKSCLLLQYTDKRYREKHEVTIGVQFGAKLIRHNNNNIKMQIWDTAGQESFKSITRGYYKNAIGAVLCYDITNRESFAHVTRWFQQAKTYGHEQLFFILVGNKSDQQKDRKISYEQGMSLAKQNKIDFLESSAKTGTHIEQIFTKLNTKILDRIDKGQLDIATHPGIKVGTQKYNNVSFQKAHESTDLQPDTKKKEKSKCC